MKRNWTNVAKEHNGTDQQKAKIGKAIKEVEWFQVPKKGEPPLSLGMMIAEGLTQAIKEYNIPKVTHVGCSNALAPLGLLAIRGNYKDGPVDIYMLDCGSEIVPVCSELRDKPNTKSDN